VSGSRYRGGGIGAQVFSATPPPTCPAGQHWVDQPAAAVRGLGACVANATVRPLTFHAAMPAPAPPPTLAPPVQQAPLTFQLPSPGDAAAAPAPLPPAAACPAVWPWWWLVVAAGIGGTLGYYAQRNQKAVKRNARRVAAHAGHRIVNRASDGALARLL
jgi:hypothetical protein